MLGQAKESTTPQETIDQLLIRAEADVGRDPRSMARIPFFRPVSIEVDDRSYSGFCRDLSPESIGLLHCMKLPLRDVKVIIPIATNKKCKMLVRIERCEPSGEGWFISGGKFVGVTRGAQLDDELLEALLAARQ
jgi:hypothetical protein